MINLPLESVVVGDMTYNVLGYYELSDSDEQNKGSVLISADVVETILDLIDFLYSTKAGPVTASFSDQTTIYLSGRPELQIVFPPGAMPTLYEEMSAFHITAGDDGGQPFITLVSDDGDEANSEAASLTFRSVDPVSDETAEQWVNAQMDAWKTNARLS
jgi:hypothetical protein